MPNLKSENGESLRLDLCILLIPECFPLLGGIEGGKRMLDSDNCYKATLSRDARFDGVFYIAVASTKIYCRTICRVKTPLKKNCTFYPTAAEAEAAGYRPCLRCRPELAPGNSSMDAVGRLAKLAMQRIEAGALSGASIAGAGLLRAVSTRLAAGEQICRQGPCSTAVGLGLAQWGYDVWHLT